MIVEGAAYTESGRIRENNEDNYYLNSRIGENLALAPQEAEVISDLSRDFFLAAVFDGMGGTDCGEEASLTAAQSLRKLHESENCFCVKDFFNSANMEICRKMDRNGIVMGTTAVILQLTEQSVTVGNIGDSRAYLYQKSEKILKRLTKDHTRAQQLIDAGLTTQENMAGTKHEHVLLQYLGIPPEDFVIEPDIVKMSAPEAGDVFLLCSDGLTDMLSEAEMKEIAAYGEEESAIRLCERFVQAALRKGGRDNVTVEVLKCRGECEGEQRQKKGIQCGD